MAQSGQGRRAGRGRGREGRQPERSERGSQPAGQRTQFPRGAGVYPRELVPIVLPGDFVHLKPEDEIREVATVVNVPTILAFDSGESNGITASSNQTTADQDATELEQRSNWLAQYRMVFPEVDIPTGIATVTVDLGGGQAPLYTSKNARGFIEQDTAQLVGYSAATELYVWEDDTPQFSFENTTGSNITVQDIRFSGYHIQLGPATELPQNVQPVVVPTEAIGSMG